MNRNYAIFAVLSSLAFAVAAHAQTQLSPDKIMEKVTLTRQLDGSEAVLKMTIYNDKGQKRERTLAMATKLYDGEKTEKRIYKFLSPADVKGTGILTFDYDTKDDDMWIFMPALRKTRRILASQKSKSFMGSEFSYGDFGTPILSNYSYKNVKKEKIGADDCWVIEITPKDQQVAKDEGYSKKSVWVGVADFTIRKAIYYDLSGVELKTLAVRDIQLLDPAKKRYRAKVMEMTNVQNKCRSVFESTQMAFSPNVKEDYFTTSYLERP